MSDTKRLAILGAGPVGIEAATRAVQLGFDVTVFERGRVGEHVRNWSHVELFSPWKLNRSPWGTAVLAEHGISFDDEVFPTGGEFLEQYLEPLAHSALLEGRIHEQTEVLSVSRRDAFKGQFIGRRQGHAGPFLIHVRRGEEERYEEADVVVDTTGSYRHPRALGPGGMAALGERRCEAMIERYIPDLAGEARETYAGKRVLVVGGGYSAVTSLQELRALKTEAPGTQISWLVLDEAPYDRIADDPLPQRDRLARLGNDAASGKVEGITPLVGAVLTRLTPTGEGAVEVTMHRGGSEQTFVVDRVVANVGYRPDTELYREVQVHLCYASEGPMKLAASLLAAGGGSGDCLAQSSAGVETLMNPEPDFFVLGMKSYGRGSAFLLKLGVEQVEQVMGHLAAPPSARSDEA
ncbi:MAG: NAD(P)-binding domain-containing protein [Myxococcota bacterium]